MNKNQKGFSPVWIVLILLVLAGTSFAAWRVWKSNNNPSEPEDTTQRQTETTNQKPEVSWSTYENKEAKLMFKYPSDWKSEAADTFRYEDGSFGGVGGTLTSPSNNKLTWIYQVAGGGGGECLPEPGDKAFSAGNKCPSKLIISVEKIPTIKAPAGTSFRNLFEDSLYITKTKHMDIKGKTSFQLCLDAHSSKADHFKEPVVGTEMGFLFPCEYWQTGFNVKFEVENENEFESDDAKMAEKIMKTFNSL